MENCLFCKMARGEVKPDIVYEDENLLAFRDIHPKALTHILIVPRAHIATLNDLDNPELAGQLLQAVAKIAQQEGIAESGYRTVINCNHEGGQEIYHLHLHLLGGRKMRSMG